MPRAPKKPEWALSDAKRLLTQDMMDGLVPVDQQILSYKKLYQEFYEGTPEFTDFPWDHNFSGRVKRLQRTVRLLGTAAQNDAVLLAHDRILHPPPGTHASNGLLLWEGSEADHWLRVDMTAGLHLVMTKTELFESRDCYLPFGKTRFTKRIDQITEKGKEFGATPGQNNNKKKLPRGLKGKSRKALLDKYVNTAK